MATPTDYVALAKRASRLRDPAFLYGLVVTLDRQLAAMTAAERLVHDDRDRLEGELAMWKDLAKGATGERDEARALVRGLLRLAMRGDWLIRLVAGEANRYAKHDLNNYRAALAALPPWLRRLLDK